MTDEEQVKIFNAVGMDLNDVVLKNAYENDLLNEEKLEITLKSLMFFTIKTVYDQMIPEATMVAYVRGVYNDLNRIAEGRDDRAETIASLTEQ